jgi:hypothetical protein
MKHVLVNHGSSRLQSADDLVTSLSCEAFGGILATIYFATVNMSMITEFGSYSSFGLATIEF